MVLNVFEPLKFYCNSVNHLSLGSKYALTTASLIVTGVDINTDTGVYECTGSNKNGNSTDKSIGKSICVVQTSFHESISHITHAVLNC